MFNAQRYARTYLEHFTSLQINSQNTSLQALQILILTEEYTEQNSATYYAIFSLLRNVNCTGKQQTMKSKWNQIELTQS